MMIRMIKTKNQNRIIYLNNFIYGNFINNYAFNILKKYGYKIN